MEDELSYSERREWAKDLYTKLEKTNQDIAALTRTDEATVRHWAAQGAWDGVRESLAMSKSTQLKRLYGILQGLDAKTENPEIVAKIKNLEMILKLTAAIQNLESDDGLCPIIEAAEQFTTWLLRKDVEFAKKVTVQFDAFIKQKMAA